MIASTRATKFRTRTDRAWASLRVFGVIEGAPHGFLTKQVWFDRMIDGGCSLHEIFEVNRLRTHRHVMQKSRKSLNV